LWERIGMAPFVSTVLLPKAELSEAATLEEEGEKLVAALMEDISEILKVTSIKPSRIVLMVAPRWKHDMVCSAVASADKNIDIGRLIKEAMKTAPQDARKEIPPFAKEIATEVSRTPVDKRRNVCVTTDELETLGRAKRFFSDQFGCEVHAFSADDPAKVDPKGRSRHARPGRPAVYVE
ncbi:MAG: hypothetical protein LN411_02710, partial [Candidatus Thermoplasmatota archaeon]|nr:hypothetical protein [Candidatus Thermoplasmatota archaeon]